jgi:hypothetical protein
VVEQHSRDGRDANTQRRVLTGVNQKEGGTHSVSCAPRCWQNIQAKLLLWDSFTRSLARPSTLTLSVIFSPVSTPNLLFASPGIRRFNLVR